MCFFVEIFYHILEPNSKEHRGLDIVNKKGRLVIDILRGSQFGPSIAFVSFNLQVPFYINWPLHWVAAAIRFCNNPIITRKFKPPNINIVWKIVS